MIDLDVLERDIEKNGFYIAEELLEKEAVANLKAATEDALAKELAYQGTKNYDLYGTVQVCPMYGGAFIDVLNNKQLVEPFNKVLGEGCIIWSYIATSLPPNDKNFTTRIHVDRPYFFPNYIESMGALVLLDDFTHENGATYYLPQSHTLISEPTEAYFFKNAKRLIAPAGSVFFFNLRLWHAGGTNQTNNWRHALSIGMTRPYLKQKFDIPELLKREGIDIEQISPYAKQKLGFNAIPPKSLDEFWGKNGADRTYTEKSEWLIANKTNLKHEI